MSPAAPDQPDPGPGPGPGPEPERERGPEPSADSLELSERDRAVLALERKGWASRGVKERAIREQLGISPARYYQVLNALLDDPLALAHDPVTINRLRRIRESRRARR
ncbi:DUF3263 domain-containing protein [Streptomyces cavernicola]|uniref:DUF3263 domain-containing protein n=1 Tax=Streptomyces cavernicola TaxID=3043613 RepID=A0ABT6SN52_9ACTN|nr:DUF3263 domain-containing protein [Streptomyces sp. B-S-A6]MDI3409117.1 DUF3263 domain-containing protein [Streptomyces sp. B-S-A6]